MDLLHLLLLAVIQGIAEFLPISSSGHLVVAAALLGEQLDIADVNIVLHLGTLVAILIFYFHRIIRLLTADRRVVPLLIVGTLPVTVLGLTIKRQFAWMLESPALAGVMLVLTGLILLLPGRFRTDTGTYQDLTWRQSFWIGCAQSLALMPGISRSGTTIVAGLAAGLSRRDAAAFSFLLAIPAISGASVLQLVDMIEGGISVSTPAWKLVLGALVSCVVGWAALSWLVSLLEHGRLHYFSIWCVAVGLGVLIWQVS